MAPGSQIVIARSVRWPDISRPGIPARLEICSHNTSAVNLYTKLGFAVSDRGYAVLASQIA